MKDESPAQYSQEINIVDDKPFITTVIKRLGVVTNKMATTFKNTVPYEGTLEDLRLETERLKQAEIDTRK